MLRALFVAVLVLIIASAGSAQPIGVLHIKVVLTNSERKTTPVPNHALLISDNPATSAPRRVVTAIDGTVDVRLRPGNYTVESDEPLAFDGRGYQWTQNVDIVAGRDVVLELTADNAEIGAAPKTAAAATHASSLSSLLMLWQDSVVALWTPTTHASGFVIDARGLIATNERVIGGATSVEVQFTPAVKVTARVLAADSARDVAVLWIDQALTASVPPVSPSCAHPETPVVAVTEHQDIFTIGAPLRQQKGPAFGTVSRVDAHSIAADLRLPSGSPGGPVFTPDGTVIGLTSVAAEKDAASGTTDRKGTPIVRMADVCAVVASAENKMKNSAAPVATHLPVEPTRTFSENTLKEAAKRRVGSLNPYLMSSSDFDIAFITPVEIAGAQDRPVVSPLMDFGNWSEYVADIPPVLLIRVMPKLVEGFWTTVARGAAYTQGAGLPPIRHAKSSLARMRVFCGDAEVMPIHPFRIQHRVSDTDVIDEGLYVVDPDTLGPQCSIVKLTLYSEKDPEKGDTRVVDPKALPRIRQDFALDLARH